MSEALSRKLREARALLQLSQAEAAKTWGLTLKSLRNWEQGRHAPRGYALTAINQLLDAILRDAPPPRPKESKD